MSKHGIVGWPYPYAVSMGIRVFMCFVTSTVMSAQGRTVFD